LKSNLKSYRNHRVIFYTDGKSNDDATDVVE